MPKIYYPAVFHVAEDVGGYWIEFPDLPGCFSQGKNDIESLEMAKDALSLWLDKTDELFEKEIEKPSSLSEIQKNYPNEIVMLVEGDPDYYARKYNTKAVKKTLSIPQWLNDKAIKANINFSQVLQEALINKLGL
ncbi:MAG: type II toxin-antitoxin system HicB family antitoxin [Erysipelotrichaceae bacterium]|nr:type II toxin-antitoxin system HicB family antitoxin [Erysipelotrichaceae bacterium]